MLQEKLMQTLSRDRDARVSVADSELREVPRIHVNPSYTHRKRAGIPCKVASTRKISREELFAMVWEMPTREGAKELGVSDVAIGKLCARLQVPKPPRGYSVRADHAAPAADCISGRVRASPTGGRARTCGRGAEEAPTAVLRGCPVRRPAGTRDRYRRCKNARRQTAGPGPGPRRPVIAPHPESRA